MVLGLALAAQGAVRAVDAGSELDRAREDALAIEPLGVLAESRPAAFTGCGPLWTAEFLAQAPLAWWLERSVSEIVTTSSVAPAQGRIVVGPRSDPGLAGELAASATPIAGNGGWTVYGTGACRS